MKVYLTMWKAPSQMHVQAHATPEAALERLHKENAHYPGAGPTRAIEIDLPDEWFVKPASLKAPTVRRLDQ